MNEYRAMATAGLRLWQTDQSDNNEQGKWVTHLWTVE
jgi:hypothetical protein